MESEQQNYNDVSLGTYLEHLELEHGKSRVTEEIRDLLGICEALAKDNKYLLEELQEQDIHYSKKIKSIHGIENYILYALTIFNLCMLVINWRATLWF